MMKSKLSSALKASCVAVAAAAAMMGAAQAQSTGVSGNRYSYDRYYAGDISVSVAFQKGVVKSAHLAQYGDKQGKSDKHDKYNKHDKYDDDSLTIVDVRDATEYAAGHPLGARHIPYPRVFQECKLNPANVSDPVTRTPDGGSCLFGTVPNTTVAMTDEQLFLYFEAAFPNKAERLALLCRTGSRSVRAANVLSNPEKTLGSAYRGRGYTQVYNIWEGFVGQPLVPIHVNTGRVIGGTNDVVPITLDGGVQAFGFKAQQLDLNSDGKLDIYDNDGWRYHHQLPYSTKMDNSLLNQAAFPHYNKP